MAINKEIKYCYNDIAIVPSIVSDIKHRNECCPFYNGMLPLFTAPMSSVVDENNFELFERNKINAILPRTVNVNTRVEYSLNGKWSAFGLNEFESLFINKHQKSNNIKILIDIANGHMRKMIDLVKSFKTLYANTKTEIMVGNIANPLTYKVLAEAGADYIRINIGTGAGCITSSNTAIHYPVASLIDDIVKVKDEINRTSPKRNLPKIIADGGIRNYSDIIKAIALGADYAMIGGLFSSCVESSAEVWVEDSPNNYHRANQNEIDSYLAGNKELKGRLYKKFYGMASKEGQIDLNGEKTHTSEGISKFIKIKYNLPQWTENLSDYLRSAMSYTNSRTLDDLKNSETIVISKASYESINK